MINPEPTNKNSAVIEPNILHKPEVKWMPAYNQNSAQRTPQKSEKWASFDQLLQICLNSMNHEMRIPIDQIFQAIETLENRHIGPMTDEQLEALTALRQQAQALGQMIDGLMYIVAFSEEK